MTSNPALPAGFPAHPALDGLAPSISSDPDVHLMMLFQDGDEEAFAQLVRRNQHKVFAVIYRFLGERTEAEDLTQEVFLRVYRTAGRYEPTAKFSTWLYRIATNISLNAIRNRGRFHAGLAGGPPGRQRGLPPRHRRRKRPDTGRLRWTTRNSPAWSWTPSSNCPSSSGRRSS